MMASETRYRIALTILLLALLGLVARNVFAQETKPRFKVEVVGKADVEPLKIDVMPKFVIPMPYKRTTFRVRWRIDPHADNRKYRLESECDGGEKYASEQALDGENEKATREVFQEFHGGPCYFTIVLLRIVEGKEKLIVRRQEVTAPTEGR